LYFPLQRIDCALFVESAYQACFMPYGLLSSCESIAGMTNEESRIWTPAGIYRGLFDGYVVGANRHQSREGETAWHVRVHRNSGDFQHRDYWVVNSKFYKTLRQTITDSGTALEMGGEVCDVEATEKAAIMKAVLEWETTAQNS
jgi:hypothetical protein